MTTKQIFYTTGLIILGLGVFMFINGVSMFTYQGSGITPLESEMGMYSFIFWLPVSVVGIIVLVVGRFVKK